MKSLLTYNLLKFQPFYCGLLSLCAPGAVLRQRYGRHYVYSERLPARDLIFSTHGACHQALLLHQWLLRNACDGRRLLRMFGRAGLE